MGGIDPEQVTIRESGCLSKKNTERLVESHILLVARTSLTASSTSWGLKEAILGVWTYKMIKGACLSISEM